MFPEIVIGSLRLPSFQTFLIIGFAAAAGLAAYLRPSDFPIRRREMILISILLLISGLAGARMLFILLKQPLSDFTIRNIFSLTGGYAYFGSLILSIFALAVYAKLRNTRFLALADYAMPFLLLSQVFVRIGCLMAGCCYGRPTGSSLGVVFKSVDHVARHPTQAYEIIFLILIYIIGRRVYNEQHFRYGLTSAVTVFLYGFIRFFNEYLRTDSPVIFLNITMAQAMCMAVAISGLLFMVVTLKIYPVPDDPEKRMVRS